MEEGEYRVLPWNGAEREIQRRERANLGNGGRGERTRFHGVTEKRKEFISTGKRRLITYRKGGRKPLRPSKRTERGEITTSLGEEKEAQR